MTQNLRAGLAELAGEARSVDLRDRVLKGSRRRAIRQRIVGGAMAGVALVGVIGALMLVRPDGEIKPPVESPTPTLASPSTSPSPSPSPTLALTPSVDIRNATFVVPKFPGGEDCPAGTRRFVDGRADAATGPEATTLVQVGKPTVADVDGVPGAEILTMMWCHGYGRDGQVLALKVSLSGELSPLGFVLRSPDHPTFEVDTSEPIVVRDGVVEVTLLSPGVPDGGHNILDLQVRGYRFEGGSFHQVSGPTKFAAPPSDAADIANATVEVNTTKWRDYVKLVNGSGQAQIDGAVYSVTMVRSEYMTDPTTGIVLYRIEDPQGVVTETIVVYGFVLSTVPADYSFAALESGQDGIAHINTFDAIGRQVKVTVALTAGGTEVRTYQETTNGQGWERVS